MMKTTFSNAAVNNIKSSVKKVYDIKTDIPELFTKKRMYMQSNEFLNNSHNATMFVYIDKLMKARDKIAKEIEEKFMPS